MHETKFLDSTMLRISIARVQIDILTRTHSARCQNQSAASSGYNPCSLNQHAFIRISSRIPSSQNPVELHHKCPSPSNRNVADARHQRRASKTRHMSCWATCPLDEGLRSFGVERHSVSRRDTSSRHNRRLTDRPTSLWRHSARLRFLRLYARKGSGVSTLHVVLLAAISVPK